jgi:hypothetical protein
MSEVEQETRRILCKMCRAITHHHLRAKYSRTRQIVVDADGNGGDMHDVAGFVGSQYDNVVEVDGRITTSIWSCGGCDEETFECLYQTDLDANGKWQEEHRTYYPERLQSAGGRQRKHFQMLSAKLNDLYAEVINSFNHGSMLLFTIGLRSLLEGICKDKGLTDGNLEHKINGLTKFLPNVNVIEALHNFRFSGNAAAHDLDPLKPDDAQVAIEIIEDLLNFLYQLDYKASQVRAASNKGVRKSGLVH